MEEGIRRRERTHRLVTNEQDPRKGMPKGVTHLTIHPSVRVLVKCAFQNCRSLVAVTLPRHLQVIGENAFQFCFVLETIQIPSSVETIGKRSFKGCRSLWEVGLQEGLKLIGGRAFEKCVKLSLSSLPSSVTTIGESGFQDCESIVKFELHQGLQKLGDNLFQDCYKMQRLSLLTTKVTSKGLFHGCVSLVEVQLPNGLPEIGVSTFDSCKFLQTISIPATVRRIGKRAFCSCVSLSVVELEEGLVCIESMAFGYCESLMAISLPSSVEMLHNEAFAYCRLLTGVELAPDTKIQCEGRPFLQCSSLITIALPMDCAPAGFDNFVGLAKSKDGAPDDYRNRFANLPIHAACYHASRTTVKDLELALDYSCTTEEANLKDAFGMTPFHILATSAIVRVDLLEVLLERYPSRTLSQKDNTWKTMMVYLKMHKNPKIDPLKSLVLEKILKDAMDGWGLERWKLNLLSRAQNVQWVRLTGTIRERIRALAETRRVVQGFYDSLADSFKMELTTILELTLWKRSIIIGDPTPVDKAKYRTTCGADGVIPHVAEFLWDENTLSESLVSPVLQCDLGWAAISMQQPHN